MAFLPNERFEIKDGPNLDAFGRFRTSDIFTIFDSKSLTNATDFLFDTETSGGSVNYLPTESSRELSVTAVNGNYAIFSTKRAFNYQPAKSQLVNLTGVMSIESGVIKRIGLIDHLTGSTFQPDNGMFFETDGTDLSVNIINNTVITKITQDNWNIDKLNGSGGTENPSGILLNMDNAQIFIIDFEWLGVGRIRFGFNINGQTYYCHEVLNANNTDSVYVRQPNLHGSYEIRSTGGAGTMKQICMSISSEGGFQPNGILRTINNDTSLNIAAGASRPILAFRLKSDARFIETAMENITAIATDRGDFKWVLKLYAGDETIDRNGTPTAWTDITFTELDNSNIEYKNDFLTTDTIISGQGIALDSGFRGAEKGGTASTSISNNLILGSKINGTMDVLVLELTNVAGNPDDYWSTITFREII